VGAATRLGGICGSGVDQQLVVDRRPLARVDPDRTQLRLVESYGRTLVAVHSSGAEYLSTPHDSFPADELVRHRFADDVPLARLSA
jgi:hypothetical protein